MSDSYVDGKVREALTAAKGSRTVAQQMLMAWAVQDERLLLGMAQPFLKAIAAAAIERVGRGAGATPARAPQPGRPSGQGSAPRAMSREALERVLSRMGEEPAAPARPAASPARPAAPAQAPAAQGGQGVNHEKSMMAIAKAFAAKKMG
ncbi:hypothetical protein [Azospirillum sp.]|uniref:hypothetical protein n=1 Tax=Azospirillum sp. TaxID=34012 RepID=UPI002D45DC4C|nr:hypothetical protein [Azospirillum sp.]HYD64879.1 hypothetical protein [Azospirillum sp.]